MNIVQKKYLCKRIDETSAKKMASIKEPEVDALQIIKKSLLDKNGKLQLKSPTAIFKMVAAAIKTSVGHIYNSDTGEYDTTAYRLAGSVHVTSLLKSSDAFMVALNKQQDKRNAKLLSRQKKLESYVANMKDQVMFGNDKEALAAIQKFEAKQF